MTTTDLAEAKRYRLLADSGILTAAALREAGHAASARGVEIEKVLIHEYGVPRLTVLKALSEYYGRPFIEYDERMPIAPEILAGLDGERLSMSQWFPVIKEGDTIVIAANRPDDPDVVSEVRRFTGGNRFEFWVALGEDIQWFIQDFLHSKPGHLIGTERTGLAFWRNTMAQWRTRLACYRTDLATARTELAVLRWGLGLIGVSNALMRTQKSGAVFIIYWLMTAAGFSLVVLGLRGYIKIRKSMMKPPRHHTLVEVTSATMHFLDNYHFIEGAVQPSTKGTMLARLGDFLSSHCTILYPSPSSRERTHLARERNVLAGQRTVAGCYRTIYARARTGLAFIRTGVSFTGFGLGLMRYFGVSALTVFDSFLFVAGILMVVDGIQWYMPVRKEQAEIPRCPVPE
jgi:uncharacterized membrane protein YidH (DUF202 family)